MSQPLTAFALNCSLRPTTSEAPSSTDKIIADLFATMAPHGVTGTWSARSSTISGPACCPTWARATPGPPCARILAADIFVLGLPIWLGNPSSVAKRVLERMDAFLSETDDRGRMPAAGKVAVVAVVGNEDGAHACHAQCFQALNDVGFTIPANAGAYWVGEAMHATNYVDLDEVPDVLGSTLRTIASNTAHLAHLLKAQTYPGVPQ